MAKKPVTLDANGYRKFGAIDNIAYAAGDFGCNMSFALKGTMALFWTQGMGLSAWYSLLLIIGMMVGYVVSSVVSLLNFFSTAEGVQSYMMWGMGNFGGVSRSQLPLFCYR